MARTPNAGDIGLTRIHGFTGFWISLGQLLNGDASRYTHAFVVLDDDTLIEAQPGGAVIRPLSEYDGEDVLYSKFDLTDEQRATIVATARSLEGTPYSFLDYLFLALYRIRIRVPWITRRVESNKHMICSQLAEYCYEEAGWDIIPGTMPNYVTPGKLSYALLNS